MPVDGGSAMPPPTPSSKPRRRMTFANYLKWRKEGGEPIFMDVAPAVQNSVQKNAPEHRASIPVGSARNKETLAVDPKPLTRAEDATIQASTAPVSAIITRKRSASPPVSRDCYEEDQPNKRPKILTFGSKDNGSEYVAYLPALSEETDSSGNVIPAVPAIPYIKFPDNIPPKYRTMGNRIVIDNMTTVERKDVELAPYLHPHVRIDEETGEMSCVPLSLTLAMKVGEEMKQGDKLCKARDRAIKKISVLREQEYKIPDPASVVGRKKARSTRAPQPLRSRADIARSARSFPKQATKVHSSTKALAPVQETSRPQPPRPTPRPATAPAPVATLRTTRSAKVTVREQTKLPSPEPEPALTKSKKIAKPVPRVREASLPREKSPSKSPEPQAAQVEVVHEQSKDDGSPSPEPTPAPTPVKKRSTTRRAKKVALSLPKVVSSSPEPQAAAPSAEVAGAHAQEVGTEVVKGRSPSPKPKPAPAPKNMRNTRSRAKAQQLYQPLSSSPPPSPPPSPAKVNETSAKEVSSEEVSTASASPESDSAPAPVRTNKRRRVGRVVDLPKEEQEAFVQQKGVAKKMTAAEIKAKREKRLAEEEAEREERREAKRRRT